MDHFRNISVFTLLLTGLIILTALFQYSGDDEYWIWRASDLEFVSTKDRLIIYQGNIYNDHRYEHIGLHPYNLNTEKPVRLLLRLYALPSPNKLAELYYSLKLRWQKHGVDISGLQVDYDSPSAKLIAYSQWIKQLQAVLEEEHISVTGLVSHAHDNIDGLYHLSNSAEYVVVQLYQHQRAHQALSEVIDRLDKHSVRYRIGITTHSDFAQYRSLCEHSCQGKNIFLNIRTH